MGAIEAPNGGGGGGRSGSLEGEGEAKSMIGNSMGESKVLERRKVGKERRGGVESIEARGGKM